MKIIAWLAGIGTLLGGALYMVVSLNRWEWNRALFFGLIVLIAEVGLATALVLRRLARLEYRATQIDPAVADPARGPAPRPTASPGSRAVPRPERVHHLPGRRRRAPLGHGLGGRQARLEATSPAGEERLGRQLDPISYPPGGLLLDDITVLAQEVPGADDDQIRKLLRRGGRPS